MKNDMDKCYDSNEDFNKSFKRSEVTLAQILFCKNSIYEAKVSNDVNEIIKIAHERNIEIELDESALAAKIIAEDTNRAKELIGNSQASKRLSKIGLESDVKLCQQLNSMDRWQRNVPIDSLSVPIGIGMGGNLFKLDFMTSSESSE